MSQHEIQLDSKQDMVRQGIDANGRPWTVVCDGHGKGKVIECLKSIDWPELMITEEPIAAAKIIVDSLGDKQTFRDGSTISVAKILDNKINCSWLGDSEIRIYKDGNEVWRSPRHGFGNDEELASEHASRVARSPSWFLTVVDNERITMEQGLYFHYGIDPITHADEKIAMTRSLGHNNLPYQIAQTASIPIDGPGSWKVVTASDGLWDVVHKGDESLIGSAETDAEELTKFAHARWIQEWSYVFPKPLPGSESEPQATKQTIPNPDDICVGVMQFTITSS